MTTLRVSILFMALGCAGCVRTEPAPMPAVVLPRFAAENETVLVGAGDVTHCKDLSAAAATAALLDATEGAVFVAGDGSNDQGLAEQYERCFGATWGRHKSRIRPTPGNHDYFGKAGAEDYYAYWGAAAGPAGKGYYSYDLGAWHVVVLNSNCDKVGGCEAGSEQERWLRADLAAHPSRCTLAYWHHPRFSSGKHGSDERLSAAWQALVESGAELVVSGHDHHYERFVPLDALGQPDSTGVRQFVVGTGGARLREVGEPVAGSEVRIERTHGVLRLVLGAGEYRWQFVATDGKVLDEGHGRCR